MAEEEEELIDDLDPPDTSGDKEEVSGKGVDPHSLDVGKGLYDSQINEFMRPFDKFGYLGTFST